MLLAHQGGWDEILLVLAPIAVIVGLLRLAAKRASRLADERDDAGDQVHDAGSDQVSDTGTDDVAVEARPSPIDLDDVAPPPPSGPGGSAD